jgi:hypothetical protein
MHACGAIAALLSWHVMNVDGEADEPQTYNEECDSDRYDR